MIVYPNAFTPVISSVKSNTDLMTLEYKYLIVNLIWRVLVMKITIFLNGFISDDHILFSLVLKLLVMAPFFFFFGYFMRPVVTVIEWPEWMKLLFTFGLFCEYLFFRCRSFIPVFHDLLFFDVSVYSYSAFRRIMEFSKVSSQSNCSKEVIGDLPAPDELHNQEGCGLNNVSHEPRLELHPAVGNSVSQTHVELHSRDCGCCEPGALEGCTKQHGPSLCEFHVERNLGKHSLFPMDLDANLESTSQAEKFILIKDYGAFVNFIDNCKVKTLYEDLVELYKIVLIDVPKVGDMIRVKEFGRSYHVKVQCIARVGGEQLSVRSSVVELEAGDVVERDLEVERVRMDVVLRAIGCDECVYQEIDSFLPFSEKSRLFDYKDRLVDFDVLVTEFPEVVWESELPSDTDLSNRDLLLLYESDEAIKNLMTLYGGRFKPLYLRR